MEDLIVHRGGELLKREELDLIKLPEPTDSYVPVSHYHLADKLVNISTDILKDYTLIGEKYALARQGNQMFAVLKFQGDQSDLALSIAFRNSYDRSMSLGLAMGASVFICDNLALHGEVVIMRKHTKNVWHELENLAIAHLYKSQKNFDQIVADSELFKGKHLVNDEAFRLMGLLFGRSIVSPRQVAVLKDQWLRPSHSEFEDRNMWSFLNATTEVLKSCPPISIMEKHVLAYNLLAGNL
ncbi:MAG: DUF932 domain-containing protein [Deltaproteobacteria bacterium]|nr:DUF932 domain-containing protein [Deltaproteobacteria bacterium]